MLRTKLFKSFAILVLLFGAVSALFAIRLVRARLVTEAQNQVLLNLNSAWAVFHGQGRQVATIIELLADKKDVIETAQRQDWQNKELINRLEAIRLKFHLDFLAITTPDGCVVMRASAPYRTGDFRSNNPAVENALQGKTFSCAAVFTADELRQEADELAERACLAVERAADNRPLLKDVETRGLVLQTAAPIRSQGQILGVIYGGILLNRHEALVDQICETIYKNETYQGRPMGSATIFLDDIRVATTIRKADGNRAIGTRAGRKIAESVIENSRQWIGRACVLGECYLTAYDAIRDGRGKVVGMLYVGMLEKPFYDLQAAIIWRYAMLLLVFMALALLLAFTLAHRLARPIHRLVAAARAMMDGKTPPVLKPDHTSHETDTLLEAFNQMAAVLRERANKLQEANESLQAINRNYMEMLGFVAHELKGPVGTILNYVYLLREGKLGGLSENQARAVTNIDASIKLILEMIRHYLNLSRIENGELQPNYGRVDVVNDVLQQLIENYAPEIAARQIQLDNRVPPDTMLRSDLNMTREVFENMLSNAIKYGRDGGRIVLAAEKQGAYIAFTVKNDGPGIPAEKMSLLFKKFSRLENENAPHSQKGTGLGLFISRVIVEAHGGTIAARSTPDEWTEFRFTLPAYQAAAS